MRFLLLFLLCFSFLITAEQVVIEQKRRPDGKPAKEVVIGDNTNYEPPATTGGIVIDIGDSTGVDTGDSTDGTDSNTGDDTGDGTYGTYGTDSNTGDDTGDGTYGTYGTDSNTGDDTGDGTYGTDGTDSNTGDDTGDGTDGTDDTDGNAGDDTGDGTGDDSETDLCGGCGAHGTCDVATLTCVCSDEYYGPMCSLRDCGAHGAYAQDAEICVCEPGYTGALCDECGGDPAGEKFLCMGRNERYNIVAFKAKEASGFLHLQTLGFTFFEPGSNPAYDCGCKHLDSAAARFLPRVPLRDLSEQEILDAFNAISVETINQQQTTSEELADIVRANNRDRNDCKWETVMPILILGALGTVFLSIVLVIVIAWGIWYTKPRKQQ